MKFQFIESNLKQNWFILTDKKLIYFKKSFSSIIQPLIIPFNVSTIIFIKNETN